MKAAVVYEYNGSFSVSIFVTHYLEIVLLEGSDAYTQKKKKKKKKKKNLNVKAL